VSDPSSGAEGIARQAQAFMRDGAVGPQALFGFTEDQLALLDRISDGESVRGASNILMAAKLRVDAMLKAEAQGAGLAQTLFVVSPFGECPHCHSERLTCRDCHKDVDDPSLGREAPPDPEDIAARLKDKR